MRISKHCRNIPAQQTYKEADMDDQITDADLHNLLQLNPLAAEQLRRIIADRNKLELLAEIEELKGSSNGVVSDAEAVVAES
jgi:hypothetical protein